MTGHHDPSDVTILLPTYERVADLERNLTFLQRKFDLTRLRVIVLDSSREDIADHNRMLCEQAGVEYLSYGPQVHQYDKWLDGVQQVKTPFACFLPDDDLLNPDGFYDAVEFLRTHPDYTTAHGRYMHYVPDTRTQTFTLTPFFNTWLTSTDGDDPLERLLDFYVNYSDNVYAVHRTDSLRKIMENIVEYADRKNIVMSELLWGAVSALNGKVKVLNSFYMARQPLEPQARYFVCYFERFIYTPAFIEQYSRFKACLKANVTTAHNDETVDELIDLAFSGFLGRKWFSPKRLYTRGLRSLDLYQTRSAFWEIVCDTLHDTKNAVWDKLRAHRYMLPVKHPVFTAIGHKLLFSNPEHDAVTTFLSEWVQTPSHGHAPSK